MSLIHIGNAPCSWGTLEFEGFESERIHYQQMLDELVETGYTGTELGDWGFMPTQSPRLAAELEERGLTMLGAFVPVAFRDENAHAAGEQEALRVAQLLADVSDAADGHTPYIVLADANGTDEVRTQNAGRITAEMGLSEPEWRIFAHGAERIAQTVHDETGLPTVFHHHCAGFIETPDEIACLLDRTDPEILGLVLDTGHYVYGSGGCNAEDLGEALERFADRIWYVHFKDCHPHIAEQARSDKWNYFRTMRHGVFCELGKGCVDFPAVVNWLKQRAYDGWIVVEQDVLPGTGVPKESAQRNREYLRHIGL